MWTILLSRVATKKIIQDFKMVFAIMRKYHLKMNLTKSFKMSMVIFLDSLSDPRVST